MDALVLPMPMPSSLYVAADLLWLGSAEGFSALGDPSPWFAAALGAPAVLGITDLFGEDDDQSDLSEDEDEDDLFGGGDDVDGGFDDFDDFDDEFDGEPESDQSVDELEGRIDELENEVASVSSSISTVRSENEQISETVQEVEGHVRDLLDIYEMVTRGVNPFVDEGNDNQFSTGGDSAIGLFDDDGQDDASDVGNDITDASAESFFEDDLDELEDDELAAPDETMSEEGKDALDEDTVTDGETEVDAGSKSFEELKAEYEDGESDWEDAGLDGDDADGDDSESDLDDADDDFPDESANERGGNESSIEDIGGEAEPPIEVLPDDMNDGDGDQDDEDDADSGALQFVGDGDSAVTDSEDDSSEPDADDKQTVSDRRERPHLRTFPVEYVADLTAIEWIEDLVDVGGRGGAAAALEYYEEIGWISEEVRDELNALLDGLGEPDETEEEADNPLAAYGSTDHRRSLGYVSRLAADTDRSVAIERIEGFRGGVSNGT